MKKCPYCAEKIQDEAIVCKHCGRDPRVPIESVPAMPPQPPPTAPTSPQPQTKASPAVGVLGCFTLVAGLVICGLVVNSCGSSPTTTAPNRTPTPAHTMRTVVPDLDGYDWQAMTYSEKVELCKQFDSNLQAAGVYSPGWLYLHAGLEEFYRTDDPTVLRQKVAEIAALLALYDASQH